MARIEAQNETMFGVDKTHLDICDVEVNDPLYNRLTKFFSAFAQHAPANVRLVSAQIPDAEFKSSKLRTKSSISSFQGTPVYTPQVSSKDVAQNQESGENFLPTCRDSEQDTVDDAHFEPSEGIQLPFSHIASISRNEESYEQGDVINQIDQAFALKLTSDSSERQVCGGEDSPCKPKSFVLCGMGGIGKTETAIEYLYLRRDHFDAVFWIYADTTRKLAAQFATIAKELGQETASDGMDEVTAREVVKGWLAAPVGYCMISGKYKKVDDPNWLVVFDNADDPDILYDWLPTQGPGCILVTGRYPYNKENTYSLGNGLELEPFSPDVGGKMLRKLSGREQEANAVDTSIRISKVLGGLPLALFQMSAIIRQKHLTLGDFEEWYREDSKHLYGLRSVGTHSNYQYTIATTWATEQLSAPAFNLLKLLSVLDPDRVTEELLVEGAKDVELTNYPLKKFEYFNARAELIHASLVIRNMAANELRIHRLVQDVVRQRMEESELQAVFAAVMVLLSAVWPYVCGTDPTRNQLWRVPIAEKYTSHVCRLEALFGPDIRKKVYRGTPTSGYIFCSYAW